MIENWMKVIYENITKITGSKKYQVYYLLSNYDSKLNIGFLLLKTFFSFLKIISALMFLYPGVQN